MEFRIVITFRFGMSCEKKEEKNTRWTIVEALTE